MVFRIMRDFLAWVFPFYCIGCWKEDETICDWCLERAPRAAAQVCGYCRATAVGGRTCDFCRESGAALDSLLVASIYEKKSLVTKGLHNFKYKGQTDYGKALIRFMNIFLEQEKELAAEQGQNEGEKLGKFVAEQEEIIICPIPLFPAKQRSRGFNQSEILAKGINLAGKRINLLKRIAYEKAQMTLSGEARLANVKGVFEVVRENFGEGVERVLLVDDVATTLATLEEAARVLRATGVREVYGLVLARENFEIERKRL